MVWIIKICEVGQGRRREKSVFKLGDLCAPIEIERLGVSLEQGKALMAALQSAVVEIQAAALAEHAKLIVRSEPGVALKDYRRRRVQTVYGEVNLRVPRLDRGGIVKPCTHWPSNCRSTPELDSLRTTLSAWMSYRAAEQLLSGLIPLQGGRHHTTFRNRVLVKGATPEPTRSTDEPVASVSKMTLGLDCTFIRSHDRQKGRLHEVLIGHIEPNSGSSRVFSSIDEAGPERVSRIKRNLANAGMTEKTEVTTFTDGGGGLRELALKSGATETPVLDWHHVAQRIQHVRQAASGLTSSVPDLPHVTAKIIAEVERLRWRLWHGKPNAVAEAIENIRPLIKTRRRPTKKRRVQRPWSALMAALYFLRKYTSGQEAWMINYAQRHRTGERVGTSQTESAANFLVNKRMNKSQQMRWSAIGASRILQIRAAVINDNFRRSPKAA